MKKQRLTIKLLDRREELIAANTELAAKIDANKREISTIDELATAALDAADGVAFNRGRHTVAYASKKRSVSWKTEFVRVAGADAAAKLRENAGTVRRLKIGSI